MAPDGQQNPYKSPQSPDAVTQSRSRRPGPLAVMGITIASVVAGGCTFFCTCFGIGFGAYSLRFPGGTMFILAAYGGGAVAAGVVGFLVGRAIYRRVI